MPLKATDLNRFIGTDQYHRHWLNRFVLTDGCKYLLEYAGQHGCQWLFDVIASYQPKLAKNPRLRDMQFWRVERHGEHGCVVTCVEDDGFDPAVRQVMEFTDLFDGYDGDHIDVWLRDGVALLPSEY